MSKLRDDRIVLMIVNYFLNYIPETLEELIANLWIWFSRFLDKKLKTPFITMA